MNQEGDNEVWLPGSSSSRRALLTTLDWFDLEQRIGLKSVAEAMFRPSMVSSKDVFGDLLEFKILRSLRLVIPVEDILHQ